MKITKQRIPFHGSPLFFCSKNFLNAEGIFAARMGAQFCQLPIRFHTIQRDAGGEGVGADRIFSVSDQTEIPGMIPCTVGLGHGNGETVLTDCAVADGVDKPIGGIKMLPVGGENDSGRVIVFTGAVGRLYIYGRN
jgi:hypothetical protein